MTRIYDNQYEKKHKCTTSGGRGVLWGYTAYLLGFGVNYLLVSSRLPEFKTKSTVTVKDSTYTLAELTGEVQVATWKLAGISFYNTHFIDAVSSGFVGVFGKSGWSTNLVTSAGGVFLPLLVIVPLLLIGAGIAATRNVTESAELRFTFGTGKGRFFVNGGLISLLGYAPLIIIGSLVLTVNLDGEVVAQVDLLKSMILGGILYPFIFGGLGGLFRSYID